MQKFAGKITTMIGYASVAVVLALPLCGQTKSRPAKDSSEEITVLPRYTVLSEMLTITFSRSMGGSLTGAEVTWVAKGSIAEKRGIQVYDELLSIDGVNITGQNYTDMQDMLERELKPGESIRLLFTGRRGALGRHMNYIFTIKRAEPVARANDPACHASC